MSYIITAFAGLVAGIVLTFLFMRKNSAKVAEVVDAATK